MIVTEDRYNILLDRVETALNKHGKKAIDVLIKGMSKPQRDAFEMGLIVKQLDIENRIAQGIFHA